ncbi:precorrin-6A/cobalt-precorrin-6A reductase [Geosporobacter subterraneus DSM 17957]|uniref:Precorrin-6A/cobalt-precorrin-6A reductase n=1 Tax=Geosporobacter subterraneus DSM 17957 TaxID=1121919 RepID=A0A1M6G458_9FIRM|nr:precorrin-6A reductase [Geosporobacter subterraneus]SHJ04746.1 precorrin-6A/cobalt-precorrin-6A reductase [Geosporobacter subterraneus DSM 17957]
MIMILGGTKDAREIVVQISEKKYPLLVTTATEYGGSLLEAYEGCDVLTKRMSAQDMETIIIEKQIQLVVDATHPYAVDVSQNAMIACQNRKIPYLRYQRNESAYDAYEDILITVEHMEAAADYLAAVEGNVLLTTGSKSLEVFTSRIPVQRLYPRVLPTAEVLKKCETLGIKPGNIVAMQGPFSKNMNMEIIKMFNISILVTKDSGDLGGTLDKLAAASACECEVVMVRRPRVNYHNLFENKEDLVCKVSEIYEKILSNHD